MAAVRVRTFLIDTAPTVRRYILLVVVAGVPVLFMRTGHDPFNVPKLALLTAGVALSGSLRLAEALQGRSLTPMRRLWIPAVAIAGPLLVAWVFSTYRGWAVFGEYGRFQGLIPYLLVIALGLLIVDAFEGRAQQLAWALVAAASLVAFYALVQFVGADPFTWGLPYGITTQALSTLGNSNFAGGFLGIALPLAVGLAVSGERHRARAVRLSLLILAGLLATRSEGGWAAGFAGAATVLGVWFARRRPIARWLGAAVAALAIVGLGLVGAYSIARPDSTLVPGSFKLRAWWWQEAVKTAGDAPVVGHGPNAFAVEVWEHRVEPEAIDNEYAAADDPHSIPLAFLAAAGVLGALGFLAVFAWVGWQVYTSPTDDLLTAAFLGGIIAYFVQGFVTIDELSLRVALWTVLAGWILARTAASSTTRAKGKKKAVGKSNTQKSPAGPLKAPIAVALLAVVAGAGMVWSAGLLIADHRYLRGEQLFASGDPEGARRQFEQALGFRDDYDMRHTYGFRLGDAGLALEREEYIDEARRIFSFVWDFPDVAAIRDYARIMREWSQVEPEANDEAKRLYAYAAEIDPENPVLQEEAANVLQD